VSGDRFAERRADARATGLRSRVTEPAGEIEVNVRGHRLVLMAERAVFVPALRAVFVADLHLGKADAIAATGVPMPPRAIAECWTRDLSRLLVLARRVDARSVYVLGDLLHARSSRSAEALEAIEAFVAAAACEVTLVRGNHDLSAGDPPTASGIVCVDEPHEVAGMWLRHHPPGAIGDAGELTLCGHIHPAVRVGVGVSGGERAGCFHLSAAGVLTLPAFGSLTGCKVIEPGQGDRVWVVGPGEMLEVPTSVCGVRMSRGRARGV
jgi:uncharacterized protein